MTQFRATSTNSVKNLHDEFEDLLKLEERSSKEPELLKLLEFLAPRWNSAVDRDFDAFALAHQKPPAHANNGKPWTTWLLLGGRGAGKTRAGAEWVRRVALADGKARIALVAETEHEAREVMVEGVSGLLTIHRPYERPVWRPTRRRLQWRNGAIAQLYSAENPDALRGPQFSAAWLDELAKWRHAEATFDMLQFGLRLGERPRQVVTTTPRPSEFVKRLIADPATAVTCAATHANAHNLSPGFLAAVLRRYEGTQLGRQEILGEIIAERADALWTRAQIEASRVRAAPGLRRVVVAVDPPGSSRERSDACGLVAAGQGEDGLFYVLADDSAQGLSPQAWASRAVALWRRLNADALIAESNFGGEMVRAVIGQADRTVPVRMVHATRGKFLRAEPVALLYEQGRVRHAGVFPHLEDEMCDFGRDGLSSGRSPDRLDALVWALTALTYGARTEPRIRGL
jgi:phage terminase large subunit-like protein